jgi:hypothetical protein
VQWDATARRALASPEAEPEPPKKLVESEGELTGAATPVTVTCSTSQLTPTERAALVGCRWPGRSHVIEVGDTFYYLDGAHTRESCDALVQWLRHRLPPRGIDARGSVPEGRVTGQNWRVLH